MGRRKVFITGQAKLNPEHYSIKYAGSQYFTIAGIPFLSVIVKCYKPNRSKSHTAILFIMNHFVQHIAIN